MSTQDLIAVIKKNPISVGCGLLCLGLVAAIYFRSDEIPGREADLAQKSAEGERHALNIKNSHELKEQYDALVAANKEIDSRLVRASQLAANSEFFYRIESATGVKIIDGPRQNAATAPKGKAQFTTIGFNVSAQGDITQLLNFLHHLESGEHYCRILNATLSLNSVKRDAPLTLSLTLEILGLP
jgi:hypothetical protein